MSAAPPDQAERDDTRLNRSESKPGAPLLRRTSGAPLLGRKSVLMGMLTSGFVIANAAQASTAAAAVAVKPAVAVKTAVAVKPPVAVKTAVAATGTVKPAVAAVTVYTPKWAASTTYLAGQQVVGPNNDVVSARVAHTSAAAYRSDTAKWMLSATFTSRQSMPTNVKDYGAKGDRVTDDTAAINAAVTDWMALLNDGFDGALVFPPGVYLVSSTITAAATPGGWGISGGRIIGQGATLRLTGGAATFALVLTTVGSGKAWQRPIIQGLHVDGGGIRLRSGHDAEFIWNAVIDQVLVTGSKTAALRLSGVFESQVINSCFEMNPSGVYTADTESCIYIEKESGYAQPSSLDLTNVTTRGGYIGIRSPHAPDVKIIGGTVLAAQREGVFLAGMGLVVDAMHLENNWLSGAAGDAAAVRMEGSGRIGTIFTIARPGASMAPYAGSTSQNYATYTYIYGTNTNGALVPGSIDVARPSIQSDVVGQKTIRSSGGFAGSTLYLTGICHAQSTISPIAGGRTIRRGADATTTAGRPDAGVSGAGTSHYDTTLSKPIWSNGSVWKDANGITV